MTLSTEWLIDHARPLSDDDLDELDRELASIGSRSRGSRRSSRTLAVSLHDVVIHDTRKWFGEADIRLDALVITGRGDPRDPLSFYMPKTDTFPRIRDGDALPLGPGGLLMFHGPASHFLDLRIMVSRDRKDTQDLAQLLSGAPEAGKPLATLLGLAVGAPQVAAVTAAASAAAALGDLAFRLLQAATGATIGLYRDCHLEYRDGFGIGRHPGPDGRPFRAKDLSFRYEIAVEGPATRTGGRSGGRPDSRE